MLVAGCVGTMSYPGIEPLSFRASGMNPDGAVVVDSLTPTFRWKQPVDDLMSQTLLSGSLVLMGSPANYTTPRKGSSGTPIL